MMKFKVMVVEIDANGSAVEHVFDDASYQISGDGILQVNYNGRSLFCWAPSYWSKVSMVPQDG